MSDGTLWFASLQGHEPMPWEVVRVHLLALPGVSQREFVYDGIDEGWLDFSYMGQWFSVHGSEIAADYRFFSDDPDCSDLWMDIITAHMERLMY